MSVRSKFVIVALVAGILPMALVGFWLTRGAAESGVTLLRTQLSEALELAAARVEARWPYRRADLLLLAENETVSRALGSTDPGHQRDAREFLASAYQQMAGDFAQITYRDGEDRPRWSLGPAEGLAGQSPLELGAATALPATPTILLTYPIEARDTRTVMGTLDARLHLESLLRLDVPVTEVPGAVFTVFDRRDGQSLLRTPLEARLLGTDRFRVDGEEWISVRRMISEVPLDLALAAPVAPYVQPFQRSARTGLMVLVAVLSGGLLAIGFLTGRLTTSLERLALAADAVARGDLNRQVDVGTRDEVARVANAFNAMTRRLRRTLSHLSRREALAEAGQFAATVAHEVRNPLTSLRVDLQNARRVAGSDERLQRLLGRSLQQIDRLDDAVGGALELVQSGRIRRERIDLRVPLRTALHAARPELEKGGVSLWAEEAKGPEVLIAGDANALERLFLNVLLNAAQAFDPDAPQPAVAVAVDARADQITVEVLDNGRGIAEADLDRVFELFFSTREEGTGLGLALSRQIVRAHGGDLEIQSRLGAGTQVRIVLPTEGGDPDLERGSV